MAEKEGLATVLGNLRPRGTEAGLIGGDPALCARVLRVDGVAVSLASRPHGAGLGELVWYASATSARLEDLQYTSGQGPGPEAAATCTAVWEPDVSRVAADRWPALLPDVLDLGVRAVFSLPLHVGGACLGTLTLQRATAGPLDGAATADAYLLARALTAVVLADRGAQDTFAAAENGSDFYRAVVHQATGMVSAQTGVPLAQSLLLLRAHAYRHGLTVVDLAEDVVGRRVRFTEDGIEPDSSGQGREEGP
ncbi:ANTAR domain-containing protein [Streptomyces sp. NPDC102406]|uniref:ANTAR domain-containing protein n=1 Tax=Streptomyces sp. NPDC102406 TaxID=3366171 RepID=UPI003801E007